MGILLVYDVTDRKSFDNIRTWMRNIDQHANEQVVKILLGNKCDMSDKRAVSKEEGEKLAQEFNIDFFETSAKVLKCALELMPFHANDIAFICKVRLPGVT